jgi:hypothetical protein
VSLKISVKSQFIPGYHLLKSQRHPQLP